MYRRRAKFNRGRRFKRRSYGRKSLRKVIRRTVVRMAETKFRITNISQNVNAATNIETNALDAITVGTGNDQRIGNQIRIQKIGFDLQINYLRNTTGAVAAWVRVCLLYPRKGIDNSGILTGLTGSNPGVHARPDPDQMLTLYDKKVYLSDPAQANGVTSAKFKFYKAMKFMPVNYDGSTDTVDRQPILYVACDASAITAGVAIVAGTLSASYKDA